MNMLARTKPDACLYHNLFFRSSIARITRHPASTKLGLYHPPPPPSFTGTRIYSIAQHLELAREEHPFQVFSNTDTLLQETCVMETTAPKSFTSAADLSLGPGLGSLEDLAVLHS